MKLALVALGWGGAALVAAAAWRADRLPWFPSERSPEARAADHLAGQRLSGATLDLSLAHDPLALRATLHGELALDGDAARLRFVAPPEVLLLDARLAGAPLHEGHDARGDWLAQPASFRGLVSDAPLTAGELRLAFELPLRRRGDGTLWEGRVEELLRIGVGDAPTEVRFAADVPVTPRAAGGGVAIGDASWPATAAAREVAPPSATTFAIEEGGGALAIGVRRDAAGGVAGLVLLADAEAATPVATRWLPLPADPRRVAWARGGRGLVVELDDGRSGFVDVERATVRLFDAALELSPGGEQLLEIVERAPGAWVERLHDLAATGGAVRRVAGLRRARFALHGDVLVHADAAGRVACLDGEGRLLVTLPERFEACRAIVALPLGWCVVVDTFAGCRVAVTPNAGPGAWEQELPLHVTAVVPSADGGELLLFGERRRPVRGAAGMRFEVARLLPNGGSDGETLATYWSGDLRPLPTAAGKGLLLADAADDSATKSLWHLPAAALARDPKATPRAVGGPARLDVAPAFGARGRYLYYLRAPDGSLRRHDFLSGRDEPLSLATR